MWLNEESELIWALPKQEDATASQFQARKDLLTRSAWRREGGAEALDEAPSARYAADARHAPFACLRWAETPTTNYQHSGIPAGLADAFPADFVGSEAVAPDDVTPTVVWGVLSDDDASVGFFSRIMLRLTSQHCLGVTP
jgi:hypothetical protein